MVVAMEAQPEQAKHIVFFDVETNVPGRVCRSYELLEFGAVVLDARGLGELRSFHTLIRPKDLSCIDRRTSDCNTITSATVADAPTFSDVADEIFQLLHGNIWAGHNILRFDILRINEAFSKIGQPSPQPSGVVDTYPLLRRTFGIRAGNYKLATLANYCGYGKQEHRSIADVRMNINVLRSCATMLFLESNYPDIFMAQMEVTTSTSVLEQSASFSTSYPQNGLIGNDNEEQEVDSQIRFSVQAGNPSSASKPSVQSESGIYFRTDTSPEVLEEIASLRRPGFLSAFEDLKLGASCNTRKEGDGNIEGQACSSSRVVMEDEDCVSSKLSEVSSVLRINHVQEHVRTCYEYVSENGGTAEVMDAKSEKVEISMNLLDANEGLSQNESTPNKSAIDNLLGNEVKQNSSHVLMSLSLGQDKEASDTNVSGVDSSSTTEFEGLPFLLASQVIVPSIEVREEPCSSGSSKTLYYNGFPLHLLELKVRVRFSINASYAFDDKGKPRFSILIEPSEAACSVISKCEDVVRSMIASDGEIEWLPALKKEFGSRATRMSIGTKWMESVSTYTTEFFRPTSKGLEKISLGDVDASTFKNALPHNSIIDTGFGFYVFNVHNRAGVRLLAKHITVY